MKLIHGKPMSKYSKIPNSVLTTLSPNAARLLHYFVSKPENFQHSKKQAVKDLDMSDHIWTSATDELTAQKHLFIRKNAKGKFSYDYHVVVDPSLMEPDMTVEEFVELEASSDIDTSNLPVNVIKLCELIDTDLNNAKYLYKKLVMTVGHENLDAVVETLILYQQLPKEESPSKAVNIFYSIVDLSETEDFTYFYPISVAVGVKCLPVWIWSAVWRVFDEMLVICKKTTSPDDIAKRDAIKTYLESYKIEIMPTRLGMYVFNRNYDTDRIVQILRNTHKVYDYVADPYVSNQIVKMKKANTDKLHHEIAKACADEQNGTD